MYIERDREMKCIVVVESIWYFFYIYIPPFLNKLFQNEYRPFMSKF